MTLSAYLGGANDIFNRHSISTSPKEQAIFKEYVMPPIDMIEYIKKSFSFLQENIDEDSLYKCQFDVRNFTVDDFEGYLIAKRPRDPFSPDNINRLKKRANYKYEVELRANYNEVDWLIDCHIVDQPFRQEGEYSYFKYVDILYLQFLKRLKTIHPSLSACRYFRGLDGAIFTFFALRTKESQLIASANNEFLYPDFDEELFLNEVRPVIKSKLDELDYSNIVSYRNFKYLASQFDAKQVDALLAKKLFGRAFNYDNEESINQICINDIIKTDNLLKCDIAANLAYEMILKTFTDDHFVEGYIVKYYNDDFTKIYISFLSNLNDLANS